jgi:hypothetical protein
MHHAVIVTAGANIKRKLFRRSTQVALREYVCLKGLYHCAPDSYVELSVLIEQRTLNIFLNNV